MANNKFYLTQEALFTTLQKRLSEKAPSLIQLVSGPRQVGKTTTLLKLLKQYEPQALYFSLDSPEGTVSGFWERLWVKTEQLSKEHGSAFLFIDEIQHLSNWSVLLKSEWDRIVRLQLPIHVVASGSSSLKLDEGSHESLAGRFERLVLPHWQASDLANAFSLSQDEAIDYYIKQGAYPGTLRLKNDHERLLAYVQDSIIESAIGRDILALQAIRRPALLRQIFNIAVTLPAQIISLQKLQGHLQDKGALATVSHYLQILEEAFLIAGIHKYTHQPLRLRQSPPKIVVLNQALCAARDPRGTPSYQQDPSRYGFWIENACLASLYNRGQKLFYWREGNHEVDLILDNQDEKWAIEIKTGPYGASDLSGLLMFTKNYPAFKPLVLCDKSDLTSAKRLGIDAIPWRQFLWEGLL